MVFHHTAFGGPVTAVEDEDVRERCELPFVLEQRISFERRALRGSFGSIF
jgi:hypothetical protein